MHKFNNNHVPNVFDDIIKNGKINIQRSFEAIVSILKNYSLNCTKFAISLPGPKLWKDVFYKEENNIQSLSLFQSKLKDTVKAYFSIVIGCYRL